MTSMPRWTTTSLIAASAVAAHLPLFTRNVEDFAGLADLVEIVAV